MNRATVKQNVEANLTSNKALLAQLRAELGEEIFTRHLTPLPDQKRRFLP